MTLTSEQWQSFNVAIAELDGKPLQQLNLLDKVMRTEIRNFLIRKRELPEAVAEDILSDAFLKAYDALNSGLEHYGNIRSWLYMIAANEANAHLRYSRRHVSLDDDSFLNLIRSTSDNDSVQNAEELSLNNVEKTIFYECLDALNQEHQEVLSLLHFADLTYEEIAKQIGITPSATKSRIYKARVDLRARYLLRLRELSIDFSDSRYATLL